MKRLFSEITLGVSDAENKHLRKCKTSREAWLKLKGEFQSSGPGRKAKLLNSLTTHRMKEGEDVRSHIDDFMDTIDKLGEIGFDINEELLSIMLLNTLPSSFDTFRRAILSRDDILKPEQLKIKILEDFESTQAHEKDESEDSSVMFAKKGHFNNWRSRRGRSTNSSGHSGATGSGENSGGSKPNLVCYRCQRIGHKAQFCHYRFPGSRQRQSYSARNAEVAPGTVGDESESEADLIDEVAFLNFKEKNDINTLCLDSGCSSHMIASKNTLNNFSEVARPLNLANNQTTIISGVGKTRLNVDNNGGENRAVNLDTVYYVPDLRSNLFSVSKITDKGYEVCLNRDEAVVMNKKSQIVLRAERKGNLYFVKDGETGYKADVTHEGKPSDKLRTWHEIMGHVNVSTLTQIQRRGVVKEMKFEESANLPGCEVCAKEKISRLPFKSTGGERTKDILEIIHTDICGPLKIPSVSGAKYIMVLIDDKSRWRTVDFLKTKDECLKSFKAFKSRVENETGKRIKYLQSDNGREFCNSNFDSFLRDNGIQRRLTAPYTHLYTLNKMESQRE